MIRSLTNADCQRMAEIYSYYILNSIYTFDEEPVDQNYMITKLNFLKQDFPCLGFEVAGKLLGYAYASKFREKPAYNNTAETTIYFDYQSSGQGYGRQLYSELLKQLKASGFKTVVAVLGLPNVISENLHKKIGFQHAGNLLKVGYKFNRWLDTGYWQLDLDSWDG